jgi:hypothetical protein
MYVGICIEGCDVVVRQISQFSADSYLQISCTDYLAQEFEKIEAFLKSKILAGRSKMF